MRAASPKAAFSLVEVALALGIVALAFIPLVQMLHLGLATMREAEETTARGLLFQSAMADLSARGDPGRCAYFDLQGEILEVTRGELPTSDRGKQAVVRVRPKPPAQPLAAGSLYRGELLLEGGPAFNRLLAAHPVTFFVQ